MDQPDVSDSGDRGRGPAPVTTPHKNGRACEDSKGTERAFQLPLKRVACDLTYSQATFDDITIAS